MTHDLPQRLDLSPIAPVAMPWIKVAKDAPYFVTETGQAWTPIGQNDGIGWVDLEGLFRGCYPARMGLARATASPACG